MSIDKNYHFRVEDAVNYGVEEAIILNNFRFSIDGHRANGTHFYEERYWTFDSVRAYCILYPFWSRRQLERIINSLIDQKVIMTGNFNRMKYDKTNWYAFVNQEEMLFLPIPPNGETETRKKVPCTSPNGVADSTELGSPNHQTVEPIPNLILPVISNQSKSFVGKPTSTSKVEGLTELGKSLSDALWQLIQSTGNAPVSSNGKQALFGKPARADFNAIAAAHGVEGAMHVFRFAASHKFWGTQPIVPRNFDKYRAQMGTAPVTQMTNRELAELTVKALAKGEIKP